MKENDDIVQLDEIYTPKTCMLDTNINGYLDVSDAKEFHSSSSIRSVPFTYNENQCGLFQVVHVLLTQLTRFTAAWALFLMSFGIYNPGWRCADIQPGNMTGNQSHTDGIWTQPGLGQQQFINKSYLNSSGGGDGGENKYSGVSFLYENKCPVPNWCKNVEFHPDTITIVTQFGLICDKSHIPSIIISIQMIGMLFGSLIAGQIGESFGRKVSIYSSTSVLSLSSGLAIFSPSWYVYSIFIFGIGLGGGGILATFMIISTEFLGPIWRARFAAIPVHNIALGIFACIIMLYKNWVLLHIMTAGVSALAMLGAFWVPESPRWLSIHGTQEQTEKVIRKIATVNKLPIKDKDLLQAFFNDYSTNEDKKKVATSTVCDLFRNHAVRMLTIKALLIYHFIQMSYYTIGFGVQALSGNFYTNFLISTLAEGPVAILVGPASNGLGRKWASSIFTVFSSTFCLAITVVYYTTSVDVSDYAIRILAVMARAMVICIIQTFNVFIVELFPTTVRSIAFGFIVCFSRVGLIMAPFLIPTTKEFLPISFSYLGGTLLLAVLILLTLPETKNKSLIDNIETKYNADSTEEIDTNGA